MSTTQEEGIVTDNPELPEDYKDPIVSEIGDSVHPKEKESYDKLDMDVPDRPDLAAKRPYERIKRNVKDRLGKEPETSVKIDQMYRLKDRKKQEWLCYRYTETTKDLHGNNKPMDYAKGSHIEVEGEQKRDVNYRVTHTEVTGRKQMFDIPFSEKEVDRLIRLHEKNGNVVEEIDLNVGDAATSRHGWISGKCYTIKNIEDFKRGTHDQLMQLGQRGLSGFEPSLSKLSQPIEKDPEYSLYKKGQKG